MMASLGVLVADGLAVEGDGAAGTGHGAEQILQHLGAAGAVQTGDTQNLALPQLEGSVLQAGVLARDVLHVQDDLTGLVGLGREAVGQLPAHHQADDLIHGQLLGRTGGHPLASRMMVTSSLMRRISSILWLM